MGQLVFSSACWRNFQLLYNLYIRSLLLISSQQAITTFIKVIFISIFLMYSHNFMEYFLIRFIVFPHIIDFHSFCSNLYKMFIFLAFCWLSYVITNLKSLFCLANHFLILDFYFLMGVSFVVWKNVFFVIITLWFLNLTHFLEHRYSFWVSYLVTSIFYKHFIFQSFYFSYQLLFNSVKSEVCNFYILNHFNCMDLLFFCLL